MKYLWLWIAGGVGLTIIAWKNVQELFQTNVNAQLPSGVTNQPDNFMDLYIVAESRASVNLSPVSNGHTLNYLNVHFEAGTISAMSNEGVVAVEQTSFGIKVTALKMGSALITVSFGMDSANDALVGIGVA